MNAIADAKAVPSRQQLYYQAARGELQRRRERRDIVDWAERWFNVEATISSPVGPIRLMPHQRAILRYMFQRVEVDGGFRFRTAIYSTIKKSGKTTIGGLVGRWAAERWIRNGDIYYVGNDADQAKERGFGALKASIELDERYDRPRRRLPNEWLIGDARARHIPTGSRVHAVATDYKGEAGSNPVLTVWTELWGFIDKAATRFWAEMAPSPTRPYSMRFIETYAGYEGESELLQGLYDSTVGSGRQLRVADMAERLGDQWQPCSFVEATKPDDLLPLWVDEASGIIAYWDSGEKARRMPWQQGEHGRQYYATEEKTQTAGQVRRLHFNEWGSAESEFVPMELWDACCRPAPLQPGDRTPVVIALDAAVSGDCFGLVAVTRDPDSPKQGVAVRVCRKWAPPAGGGKINFDLAAGVIEELKTTHNVVQVCYDPYQLEYFAAQHRQRLGLWFEAFEQGERRLKADKQLHTLILEKRLRHMGDPGMREHIQAANAKTQKDEDGKLRIVKKADRLKIDLAVALSMACAECMRLNL